MLRIQRKALRTAVLAAVAIILLPIPSRSQFVRGWGVKGGVVGAFERFTISVPAAGRMGAQGGLFVEFINVPHVSFDVEVAYVQKGRKVTGEEVTASATGPSILSPGPAGETPRLDYVGIALFMKGRAGSEGFVPYVLGGPVADFLVAKRSSGAHLFDGLRTVDVALGLGVGCEIVPWHSPVLSVEARWSPSLSRIYENGSVRMKNETVAFLVALWL